MWSVAMTENRRWTRSSPGAPERARKWLPVCLTGCATPRLPQAVGRLLIAGGSRDEAATTAVLSFDPASATVRRIGKLPHVMTHVLEVALGSYVYVLGGRGAPPGTQTAAIVAINTATGRCTRVGRLPQPLSDAAAVLSNERVWLVGGLSANGPVASVLELEPMPAAR